MIINVSKDSKLFTLVKASIDEDSNDYRLNESVRNSQHRYSPFLDWKSLAVRETGVSWHNGAPHKHLGTIRSRCSEGCRGTLNWACRMYTRIYIYSRIRRYVSFVSENIASETVTRFVNKYTQWNKVTCNTLLLIG